MAICAAVPGSIAIAMFWFPRVAVIVSVIYEMAPGFRVVVMPDPLRMSRIIMSRVVVAIIRVTRVPVVMEVHPVREPADRVGGRHAPEETGRKRIVNRIRVVIDGVWARVIMVDRPALINNNTARFIVRDIDDFRIDWRYFNYVVDHADGLPAITFKISCHNSTAAKILDGIEYIRLLIDDGFTEIPGPVEIVIHQLDHFRIVQQCNDRIIPVLVGLQFGIFLVFCEIPGGLHDL